MSAARAGPGLARATPSWLATALGLAALGALQTLACVVTGAWPLSLATMAALAWTAGRLSPRAAALAGWAYGCGWLAAGTWWLFISLHRYGGLPAPLAVAAVALLSAALALYLAIAMAAWARWRVGRPVRDAALFAGVWTLAELARGVIFTGFPWAASGYAQVDGPLAALFPWVGVYLAGAAAAAGAALLVAGRRPALAALAVLAILAVLPVPDFTRPTGRLRLALLQPAVAQDEKFSLERMPETLAWIGRAMTTAQADLVIAPETAVPLLPGQLDDFAPGYREGLEAHFAVPGRAVLFGMPLGDEQRGYTNSVVGLSAGAPYRYDKHHLVPFGEFIPTGFRWFTEMMNMPLGDFARGVPDAASFVVAGERVAPHVCYEDLFGEELALRFRRDNQAPTVLVNVSNIGWFGDTIAVPQHLGISRARSLELQRPVVRATNTGATAVIDHRGVVRASLPPFQRGVLAAEVQGRQGRTPFAAWASVAGLWPVLLLALAGVLQAALARRSAYRR